MQELLGFGPLDIENGFGRFCLIGFTEDMTQAFQGMHVYITIIHAYLEGTLMQPDNSLICDQRNMLQFRLISLPPASELGDFHQDPRHSIIYEACRLAALIYGVGVITPIPAQASPLARLARLIQATLIDSDATVVWDTPLARVALFWVLTLGGIAAEFIPERVWFVNQLGEAAKINYCCCWPDLRNLVGFMPWYGHACDPPAQALWSEVETAFELNANLPLRCCADPGYGGV